MTITAGTDSLGYQVIRHPVHSGQHHSLGPPESNAASSSVESAYSSLW